MTDCTESNKVLARALRALLPPGEGFEVCPYVGFDTEYSASIRWSATGDSFGQSEVQIPRESKQSAESIAVAVRILSAGFVEVMG